MNQKGFASVFLFMVIMVLCAGMVAGSYYVKFKHPELIASLIQKENSKSTIKTSALKPQETEVGATAKPIDNKKQNFQDKVVFQSPDGKIMISSSTGQEVKSFNDELNKLLDSSLSTYFVSPDSKKILFEIFPKFNLLNTEESLIALANLKFYIINMEGTNLNVINIDSLKSKYSSFKYFAFYGWSTDSQKLILVATNNYSGSGVKGDEVIIEFDPETSQEKELFRINSTALGKFFYDREQGILTYKDNWGSGNSETHIRNLKTNQDEVVPSEKLGNSYGSSLVGGKFFLHSEEQLGKSLKIYSIYNPSSPIAETTLTANKERFGIDGHWSPNYNYFYIDVRYDQSGYGVAYKAATLNFYNQKGEFISNTSFVDQQTKDTDLLYEVPNGSIFSTDESKVLYVTTLATSLKKYSWRVIDVKTGKILGSKIFTDILGKPILWF